MSEQYDINDTLECIRAGAALGGVYKALSDGVDWSDLGALVPVATTLPKAIENYQEVPLELADVDSEEQAQIDAEIAKINLSDDVNKAQAVRDFVKAAYYAGKAASHLGV